MDPNVLPSNFEVIVVGTGLVESIVSAASSRIGKTVLHIDNQPNYGGDWASFNLEAVQELPKYCKKALEPGADNNALIHIGTRSQLKDVEIQWHVPLEDEITEEGDTPKWSQQKLLEKSNKFIIDLAPKLHFANGDLVKLLISSNIARYTEFRSVSRIMTFYDNKLLVVPCSRADIFSCADINLLEKRLLMMLFTEILGNESNLDCYTDKTLAQVLKDKKLTDRCIHYIVHAIAMTTMDESYLSGIKKIQRFLNSLGRFGKTPFLYCMWGSAEIPQAFCRISAVFGGVYALNQPLKNYNFDDEGNFKSLLCGEQEIVAEKLVTGIGCKKNLDGGVKYMSKCILLTDSSILKSENEHLTLLLLPSADGLELCQVIEAGSRTGTTIEGLYLVYFLVEQKSSPQEDLKFYVDTLCGEETSPKILWSCYFSMPLPSGFETIGNNGFLCAGPDMDLDYDESIKEAKAIFGEMYPGEEFLPRAPDPEDIIIGGDDDNDTCENQAEVQEASNLDAEKES